MTEIRTEERWLCQAFIAAHGMKSLSIYATEEASLVVQSSKDIVERLGILSTHQDFQSACSLVSSEGLVNQEFASDISRGVLFVDTSLCQIHCLTWTNRTGRSS